MGQVLSETFIDGSVIVYLGGVMRIYLASGDLVEIRSTALGASQRQSIKAVRRAIKGANWHQKTG